MFPIVRPLNIHPPATGAAPTGACCLSGGGCTPNQTQAQCNAVGGTWQGAGTDCTTCAGGGV